MMILSCSQLKKSYDSEVVLDGISFSIQEGQKVGLIGDNGSGKTTLFKILTGELSHDEGHVFIARDKQLGYLQQTVEETDRSLWDFVLESFADLMALEKKMRLLEIEIAEAHDEPDRLEILMANYSEATETFERRKGYAYESYAKGILRGIGFEDDQFGRPVSTLSGGERSRLALARLLISTPDILLLDEPTNHLDIDAVRWLEGFLSSYEGTLIVISHDRYFLDQIVNVVMALDHHQLIRHEGSYTDFVAYRDQLREEQRRRYEKYKTEVEKQEEIIRRFKGRGTEKLAKRAKSREKRLEHIEKVDAPTDHHKEAKLNFHVTHPSGKDVLHVESLGYGYEESLFENYTFDVYRGDKIGIIGPNGIGKTTLVQLVLGRLHPTEDDAVIQWGHNVMRAYYDQEQADLSGDREVLMEIHEHFPQFDLTEARSLLGRFLFFGDDVFKPVGALSGGEKARVALLKLMLSEHNTLLLDEPTNHLDISAKSVLEGALLDYDGTVIAISHDRYFLNRVCDKIFEMHPDHLEVYLGNYDYYLYKKKEAKLLAAGGEPEVLTKTERKDKNRREREERQEKRAQVEAQQDLESQIAEQEGRLSEVEVLLCDEAVYTDPDRAAPLTREMQSLKEALAKLYEKWEATL